MQIVFKQGIKGPDTMVNLVWANAYISGYVKHNSAGIIVIHKRFILACVYLLHNWQSYTGMP